MDWTPAAEKARSASTDVAGMVSKYACTCSRKRPLVPPILGRLDSGISVLQKQAEFRDPGIAIPSHNIT